MKSARAKAADQRTMSQVEFNNSGAKGSVKRLLAAHQITLLDLIKREVSLQAVTRLKESARRLRTTPLGLLVRFTK